MNSVTFYILSVVSPIIIFFLLYFIYIRLEANWFQNEIIRKRDNKEKNRKEFLIRNKYCVVQRTKDNHTIKVTEINISREYRTFRYVSDTNTPKVWNFINDFFIDVTDYDYIKNKINNNYKVQVKEEIISSKKLLDINSCTEKELRALPGINIILTKKIIKRREEIGGFKDKEELFEFLQLTEIIKNELTPFLILGKTEQVKSEKFDERNLDL
ncbi:helix-hairpin-helix domain-containing protein [bacterium]|nr:helix-hairpin-helix domain-containing protein [bacterium]